MALGESQKLAQQLAEVMYKQLLEDIHTVVIPTVM